MRQPPEIIRHWIESVNEEGRNLSTWERQFMESITEQAEVSGRVSEKQEEILERIYFGENGMSETGGRTLYLQSPEVHAAVYALADIAMRRHETQDELFTELIRFFGWYDRMRTDQVESLKAQLTEALRWSVRPMQTGEVPHA
jgi:hypothetical protein